MWIQLLREMSRMIYFAYISEHWHFRAMWIGIRIIVHFSQCWIEVLASLFIYIYILFCVNLLSISLDFVFILYFFHLCFIMFKDLFITGFVSYLLVNDYVTDYGHCVLMSFSMATKSFPLLRPWSAVIIPPLGVVHSSAKPNYMCAMCKMFSINYWVIPPVC